MKKVLTERPRGNSRWETKRAIKHQRARVRVRVEDPEGGEEFLRRVHVEMGGPGGSKFFTDQLGPLYHFIDSQVGKRWDGVRADVLQAVDQRSVAGRHVMQHVDGYVTQNCILVEGVPHEGHAAHGHQLRVHGLYVHPISGLLLDAGGYHTSAHWRMPGSSLLASMATHAQRYVGWRWVDAATKLLLLRYDGDAPSLKGICVSLFGPGHTQVPYCGELVSGKFRIDDAGRLQPNAKTARNALSRHEAARKAAEKQAEWDRVEQAKALRKVNQPGG